MLYFDKVQFNTLVARLDIDDTYLVDSGVEKDPHVTILYGIDMEKYGSPEDLEFIKHEVEKSGLITRSFNVDRLSTFKNDDKDVLKLDFVETSAIKKLRGLNALFTERFQVKSDFPTYKPHATVAYLQKGIGKEFVQELQNVVSFKVKKLIFSSKASEDSKEYITKTLASNRKVIAKDYVKRELF